MVLDLLLGPIGGRVGAVPALDGGPKDVMASVGRVEGREGEAGSMSGRGGWDWEPEMERERNQDLVRLWEREGRAGG